MLNNSYFISEKTKTRVEMEKKIKIYLVKECYYKENKLI